MQEMALMGSAMVQMNTRIPADLKEQGDRALEIAGYTPSQAVRALWELAAQNTYEPSVVRQALGEQEAEAKPDEATQKRINAFEEGRRIMKDAYRKMGLDPDKTYEHSHLNYKELRDLYYEERLAQEE